MIGGKLVGVVELIRPEVTMCSGYRFTAHTSESDTPVLPPVYSTTAPPDTRRPSASAASIMASAIPILQRL